LIHYVESSHLLAPWKDHKAILKEEENERRLLERGVEHGYEKESPVVRAIEQVYESTGDNVMFYRGRLSGPRDAIERVRARAHAEVGKDSPYAYVDRPGTVHLPFEEALELARKFAAAEPATVLTDVESTERKWSDDARRPGEEHVVRLLNEYRASWALIRQWAGMDAAIAQREAQIQKLERLVWDAIYALQKAKLDEEAARLRRALERR